jgi:hypothetical protein
MKKLNVWLYILEHPSGFSEKPLNQACHVVSGRNYATDLSRQYDIKLIGDEPTTKRLRETASDGSQYTVYQLLNREQAYKLVRLIIHEHQKLKLDIPKIEDLQKKANAFSP